MSALTGVSATGAVGSVGAQITVALTGVSARGSVGQVRSSQAPGESFNLRMPALQLQLTGVTGVVGDLTINPPLMQLQLVGDVPINADLTIALPTPQLQMAGLVGVVGALKIAFPAPQLQLFQGAGLVLQVPAPRLVMDGTTGVVGDLYLPLKAPRLAMAADIPVLGELALTIPPPRFSLDASAGTVGRLGVQLRALTLAMEGVTGTLGTLTINVPMVRFSADAFWESTGILQLTLPSVHLTFTGGAPQTRTAGGSAPVSDANTLVMHTERQSLTQYTNFPFNSFARFAGVYLGACDSGVFALTGDTDAGAIIQAAARTGITDFGTSHLKRADRLYIGYRSDGPLVLRVITDEGKTRDYLVPKPQPQYNDQLHGNHVRMGRGVEARYWQFEMRNQNGADFSIDIVELKPTKLRRRIGGRDA